MAGETMWFSPSVLSDAARSRRVRGIAAAKAIAVSIAVIFALIVAMGFAAPQEALAATTLDSQNSDAEHNAGITWKIDGSGILTVTFPSKPTDAVEDDLYVGDSELIIPSVMDGTTVTQVKGAGGKGSTKVTKLVYPTTLETWPSSYYSLVRNLTHLIEIDFEGESELNVAPPSANQTTSAAYFPASLEKFNANESFDCVLPASWTAIGGSLFKGCSFASLYIPATLESAASGVNSPFAECEALRTVVNDSSVWISLPNLPNITTYEMNGEATEISALACSGWTSLESISLPSSITTIGMGAFQNCTSLSSITFEGEELLTIEQSAFDGTSFTTFTVPDSVTWIGAGAFANTPIEAIALSSELWQGYDASTFMDEPGHFGDFTVGQEVSLFLGSSDDTNDMLKSVDFSGYHQTYIPCGMFKGCVALEEISIPRSVTSLMSSSFEGCANLQDVYYFGDPSNISIPISERKAHPLGYDYITAGAFGVKDGGTDPDTSFPTYSPLEGITFYGLGIMEGNELAAYAEETNCTFVPFAFLGDGGSSDDAVAKFGYAVPSNEVSIANFVAGGTPVITVSYEGEDISRTLVPGEDCTVVYTDANGNEVASFDKGGVYTATITGDSKSVWGTATVQFTVAAAPTVSVPVADASNTGITASGSIVAPDGSEVILEVAPVTEGEAYDAIVANLGDGQNIGVFGAKLLVDGVEQHDGFGTLTLTFPVAFEWNDHYVTVHHLHADGTITSERVVAADDKVSVTVTDLSTFMLEGGLAAVTTPETNPGQSDQQTGQQQGGDVQQLQTQQASASGDGSTLQELASTGDPLQAVPFVAVAGAAAAVAGIAALSRRRADNK